MSGIGLNIPDNRVRVYLSNYSPANVDGTLDLLDPAYVRVLASQGAQASACTRFDCDDDQRMRAGLDIPGCTSGFVGFGPGTSNRYVMTAGHCYASGSGNVSHAGDVIGGVPYSQEGPTADAGRIYMNATGWYRASYWIFHSGDASGCKRKR